MFQHTAPPPRQALLKTAQSKVSVKQETYFVFYPTSHLPYFQPQWQMRNGPGSCSTVGLGMGSYPSDRGGEGRGEEAGRVVLEKRNFVR